MSPPLLEEKLYTADEFDAFPDRDQYELLDGRLVERTGMGAKAGKVGSRIVRRLEEFVETHRLGHVFIADPGYVLFEDRPNRVRFADTSFVRTGRFPNEEVPNGNIRFAPDLAVEVVSPNDKACEVMEKVAEYLRAGVRAVWVAYPRSKTVAVWRHDRTGRLLTADDTLTADDVLPGFAVPVADLFAGL